MSQESVYSLTLEDIDKIIDAAPSFRDRVMIEVFARTGMRRAELKDLQINHLDFDKRRIHIHEGKGKKSRTVPIDNKTLVDIKQLVGSRKQGNVFTSPKNYPNGLSLKQINEIVAKCASRAGVRHPNPEKKQVNPHLFRHSYVRNVLRSGVPLQIVQQIVGHASIKTTVDIYGTPSQEDIQRAYEEKFLGKKKESDEV